MRKLKHIKLFDNFNQFDNTHILNEGEQWIKGNYNSENFNDLVEKVETIFSQNGKGASFTYNEKDFTITKKGERFLITSSTDWGHESIDIKGALKAAYKFSNGVLGKTGLQNK